MIELRLEQEDLHSFFNMSDTYISPIMNLANLYYPIVSCALSHGCLTISSPYQYAIEVLGNGRCIIYDFDHNEEYNHLKEGIESPKRNDIINRGQNYSKLNIEKSSIIKNEVMDILLENLDRERARLIMN